MAKFLSKRKVILFLEKADVTNLKNDRTVTGKYGLVNHPALHFNAMGPKQFIALLDLYKSNYGEPGKYLVEYLINEWDDGADKSIGITCTLDMSYVCAIYKMEDNCTLSKVYNYVRYSSIFYQGFNYSEEAVAADKLPMLLPEDLKDEEVWCGYIQARNAYVRRILSDVEAAALYDKVVGDLPIKELDMEDLQAIVLAYCR